MTILRDPRAMRRDEELGSVVTLISIPDPEEVKTLLTPGKPGFPARSWDSKTKRLRAYGRFIPEALKIPKASKAQLEKWKEITTKKT